jgi:radical SAM superfamily enzyme YgiQ (UPF0313 family)
VDDNLVGYGKRSAERIIEICKGIVESGVKKDWFCACSMNVAENDELLHWMAEAGCRMIFLGIESEVIDQLEASNKKTNLKIGVDNFSKVYSAIHKHGIAVLGAFIFGLDTDTPETIQRRVDYMLGAEIDAMQTTILTPLPGTLLYNRFKEESRLLYTNYPKDWERYHFAEVVFKPDKMTAEELQQACDDAWSRLYDNKALKKRLIKTLHLTKNATSASWAYTSNLQYHNLTFEKSRDRIDIMDIFAQIAQSAKQ